MGCFVIACCQVQLDWGDRRLVWWAGHLCNEVVLTKREFLRHETTSDGNEVATWG